MLQTTEELAPNRRSGTFYYGGFGVSRLTTSLLLGSGMLASKWSVCGLIFCRYQTLFMLFAAAIVFAAAFLLIVPAIFPKGDYIYNA